MGIPRRSADRWRADWRACCDRPRQRPYHAQRRRGRFCRAREDTRRDNYRTLLGHFRHELGSWLIRDDPGRLERFHVRSATRAPTMTGRCAATMQKERRQIGRRVTSLPMRKPPLGGLGGDLRPLYSHHRYARDGRSADISWRGWRTDAGEELPDSGQGPAAHEPAARCRKDGGAF